MNNARQQLVLACISILMLPLVAFGQRTAKEVLNREANAQNSASYYDRGLAKQKNSDLNGAMADYDQAIKLNPNYAFAFNTRGSVKQVLQVDAASYRNILLHHLPGETLRRTTRGQATNLNPQHGSTRDPLAGITFPEDVIEARLALLDLPRTTSLSGWPNRPKTVADRGRESASSPSLRTGQALFTHPALQLMGSNSETEDFEFYDSLWRYRPCSRAAVRLNSPASSKKRLRHR